jgi:predicted nucleic acid-binding protein
LSGVLVDTNVLLDVVTHDPRWSRWSKQQLEICAGRGVLYVNAIVYAELSIGFQRVEELDAVIAVTAARLIDIPPAALFLAGKTFQAYRRAGGTKSGVLPDFFLGAHAAVSGMSLLTRDTSRYAYYFPKVPLIAPPSNPAR